ncbi:MAG: hypothetical protein AAFQ94_02095 [Bacteroidota bacterium]
MTREFYKSTGVSLISGSLLMICTMILHPSGGSIERLIAISDSIITAHSIAIFSIPFVLFGFYGLTKKLSDVYSISTLAFAFIAFGLVAAMLAAMINGLAIPFFVGKYADQPELHESVVRPIVLFGFSLNTPLDYIFIVAFCLAVSVYSVQLIRMKRLPVWIGYYGIIIILLVTVGILSGFAFAGLLGFRTFVFSLAGWILMAGYCLIKDTSTNE